MKKKIIKSVCIVLSVIVLVVLGYILYVVLSYHRVEDNLILDVEGERLPLRHYGRMVAQLAEKLKTMPDGKKREELIRVVANQMKRNLVNWGHGSMDNSRVASELEKLTDGAVHLDLKAFKFQRVKPQAKQEPTKRKKKR